MTQMNYEIVLSEDFKHNFKRLFKKYISLKKDVEILQSELYKNPKLGSDLGDNTRKVRMTIGSKNKGKRGGARIITYHVFIDDKNGKIYLLTIYDKGEQDSISAKEILRLKQECGLI
jgi:mRNA-degrading endonuclease RelE of RelBE toxin-antitoxin system